MDNLIQLPFYSPNCARGAVANIGSCKAGGKIHIAPAVSSFYDKAVCLFNDNISMKDKGRGKHVPGFFDEIHFHTASAGNAISKYNINPCLSHLVHTGENHKQPDGRIFCIYTRYYLSFWHTHVWHRLSPSFKTRT